MSKVKTTYSLKEIIKILNQKGFYYERGNKHPYYCNDKGICYALTMTKDPMRIGTLTELRGFLGFENWKEMQKFWESIK